MNGTFRVDIEINTDGTIKGKVYDLSFGDEYTNYRVEGNVGPFVGQVRDEFIKLLKDIKSSCFTSKSFIYEQSNRIADEINKKYGDEPEFEWQNFSRYAAFRNKDSKKMV